MTKCNINVIFFVKVELYFPASEFSEPKNVNFLFLFDCKKLIISINLKYFPVFFLVFLFLLLIDRFSTLYLAHSHTQTVIQF